MLHLNSIIGWDSINNLIRSGLVPGHRKWYHPCSVAIVEEDDNSFPVCTIDNEIMFIGLHVHYMFTTCTQYALTKHLMTVPLMYTTKNLSRVFLKKKCQTIKCKGIINKKCKKFAVNLFGFHKSSSKTLIIN